MEHLNKLSLWAKFFAGFFTSYLNITKTKKIKVLSRKPKKERDQEAKGVGKYGSRSLDEDIIAQEKTSCMGMLFQT